MTILLRRVQIPIGRRHGSEVADLLQLAALAADAEAQLFARNPDGSGRYTGRLLGRALCQGAALHYVDEENGVKDFDVWSFYAQYDDWPSRLVGAEHGTSAPRSSAGTRATPPTLFRSERVDLLGRSLPAVPDADPADAIRRYLAARRTKSAKAPGRQGPLVLIDPQNRAGEIVWPAGSHPGP